MDTSINPAPNAPAGMGARRAALRLTDAVLRRGQRLDVAMNAATGDVKLPADRAMALALASEVLRRLPDLDALIDSATATPLPGDAKARAVLRLMLVQALRLGTPAHAVIGATLPLLEGGPRRLAHGVFGTLLRQNAALPPEPTLPAEVAARWRIAWGDHAVADAARAIGEPPPLDLRMRDDAGELVGETLAPGHLRLGRGQNVAALPGFTEGKFWVQNLAAQIPATLLGEGRTVLDLCAAPGGKTMQLAAHGWGVTALDNHAGRLRVLRENLARTRLSAETVEADAQTWTPDVLFDAVLLDAPCSATGIFARHPDVIHRIGPRDIAALAGLQARLLARAISFVKPGGVLVYATCSLEPEEGEVVINASGLIIDPIRADELPAGFAPDAQGRLRILPVPGRDGFFVARLRTAG